MYFYVFLFFNMYFLIFYNLIILTFFFIMNVFYYVFSFFFNICFHCFNNMIHFLACTFLLTFIFICAIWHWTFAKHPLIQHAQTCMIYNLSLHIAHLLLYFLSMFKHARWYECPHFVLPLTVRIFSKQIGQSSLCILIMRQSNASRFNFPLYLQFTRFPHFFEFFSKKFESFRQSPNF